MKKKIKTFLIKNRVYTITIFISIMLIVPNFFCNKTIYSILSGVGCSGCAAALMAIFLDLKIDKENDKKIKRAKEAYFKKTYNELVYLIQRILWFEERINDVNFNWMLPIEKYLNLDFLIFAEQYPREEITFNEAVNRLEKCEEKYSLDKMQLYTDDERQRIDKMFKIISASGENLILCMNMIKQNEIILSAENYLTLEKIDSITFNVILALVLMAKENKNYAVAISSIIQATQDIRNECGYTNNIEIAIKMFCKLSSL